MWLQSFRYYANPLPIEMGGLYSAIIGRISGFHLDVRYMIPPSWRHFICVNYDSDLRFPGISFPRLMPFLSLIISRDCTIRNFRSKIQWDEAVAHSENSNISPLHDFRFCFPNLDRKRAHHQIFPSRVLTKTCRIRDVSFQLPIARHTYSRYFLFDVLTRTDCVLRINTKTKYVRMPR